MPYLLNPVVHLVCLVAVSLILFLFRQPRRAAHFLVVAILWFLLTAGSPFSPWLIYQLERLYSPFEINAVGLEKPIRILVLAGGRSYHKKVFKKLKLPTRSVRLAEGIKIKKSISTGLLIWNSDPRPRDIIIGENDTLSVSRLAGELDNKNLKILMKKLRHI